MKNNKLPVLEIYSNSSCPRSCPRCDKIPIRQKYPDYRFTESMARNLAENIVEYDCRIGNLQFVGGEPLLCRDLAACVSILKSTGRVNSFKIITALIEEIDMASFEKIFDRIGVSNYGSNSHLIERYAVGNPQYEIFDRLNHHYHPNRRMHGTVPCECYCHHTWLFDDKMYFCPMTGSLLAGEVNLDMTPEEIEGYSWTFDDFFRNIEKHHSGFGKRDLCEACHVNPNIRQIVGEAPVHESGFYNLS